MARGFRRYYPRVRRAYHRSGGTGGIFKGLLYGGIASFLAPKVGINANPLLVGAAGGYFGQRSLMGAAAGAGGAYLASMFLGNGSTGGAW